MAKKLSQKLQELKRVIRLHANWLVYSTLGESALTKSELEELRQYGKLPMDKTLDLSDKSYLLGRLRALLKRSEYKDLSYEEADEAQAKLKLSPVEQMVLEQARLKAGQALQHLARDITDGVFDALAQSLGTVVTEASVKQTVADETALAVIYKKTAQQLASTLASRLQTTAKRDWTMVAQTELQRAKVAGHAQAIANKIDIYANSNGPNSKVSIIPSPSCCEDCADHYLEANGTPKVFVLADLIAAGSNADPGVSHSKKKGIHINWKTTLPPLHPNCGCNIVYIPPGYGWSAGKLTMLNKSLFEMSLKKANSTAGVSGGISSTVTPKGPPTDKPAGGGVGAPSVPGVAAPGNVAGPGKPKGMGATTPPSSGVPKSIACPLGADCPDGGKHKPGSTRYQEHMEQAHATGRVSDEAMEEHKEQKSAQLESASKQFSAQPKPDVVIKDHLSSGEIAHIERRGEKASGINASYTVHIAGNGSGLMKPPIDYSGYISDRRKEGLSPEEVEEMTKELGTAGNGTIPKNMNPRCEVGAYQRASSLGVNNVPVTVTRLHDGSGDGPTGTTSVQSLQHDAVGHDDYVARTAVAGQTEEMDFSSNRYEVMMKAVPKEHKEKVEEQFATIAVLDVIWNNNDRHFGNLMVNDKTHDLIAIDHGTTFANGLAGHRNDTAYYMHKAGKELKAPEKLYQRLKSETLESTQRAMPDVPAWAQGQTFLRQKYLLHLQDTHGHIPFDAIKGTITNAKGGVMANGRHWHNPDDPTGKKFYQAADDKELPHDKFERWAKDWIETVRFDPTHPDHADAKKLMEIQPLRSTQHITGDEPATKESLELHFNRVPPYFPSLESDYPRSKDGASKSEPIRKPPELSSDGASADTSDVIGTAPAKPITKKSLILSSPSAAFSLDIFVER